MLQAFNVFKTSLIFNSSLFNEGLVKMIYSSSAAVVISVSAESEGHNLPTPIE